MNEIKMVHAPKEYPIELKRKICNEAFSEGASKAEVARKYGLKQPSYLYGWRDMLKTLDKKKKKDTSSATSKQLDHKPIETTSIATVKETFEDKNRIEVERRGVVIFDLKNEVESLRAENNSLTTENQMIKMKMKVMEGVIGRFYLQQHAQLN